MYKLYSYSLSNLYVLRSSVVFRFQIVSSICWSGSTKTCLVINYFGSYGCYFKWDVRKVTVVLYFDNLNDRLTSVGFLSLVWFTSVDFLGASYLVDPASSHMLVSKIKPCMSKFKRLYCETADGSLYQL